MIDKVVSIAVLIGIIAFWCLILDGEVERFLRNKFDRRGWKRNFEYYILESVVWYFVMEILSCETYRLLHDMFPHLLYGLTEMMH